MSFVNEEYFLVNRDLDTCFELGPGNWAQVFKGTIQPNFTVDKAVKYVYKGAEGNGIVYVESVVKSINNWIFNSEEQLGLLKRKISEDRELSGFSITGSRFDLINVTVNV